MKYSEYGWLSENKDGWEIWDADEERAGNNALVDCRKLDWQEMVEEDCADAFFLHECNGKCKECSMQEDYLDFFFCDDCGEYSLAPGEPDCHWCPIGLRKGKKQEEPAEIRRKRIEIEQTDTIPECTYEDFCGINSHLYIVRYAFYRYLESMNYFEKRARDDYAIIHRIINKVIAAHEEGSNG